MSTSPNGDGGAKLTVTKDTILGLGKQAGLGSRKAIADAAGIPDTTFYRNLEKPGKFTVEQLGDIANALGVTATELYTEQAA